MTPEEPNPDMPLFLRVGNWNPDSPRSMNYAKGDFEVGLSAYDLDEDGKPITPEESEWAGADLAERLASEDPKYLVQGRYVGEGHDGEPLLADVIVVGFWPDDYPRLSKLTTSPSP